MTKLRICKLGGLWSVIYMDRVTTIYKCASLASAWVVAGMILKGEI